jgi:antitoxin MazE
MNATTKAQLAKWGNSLAVRIPKSIVGTARLREGDEVTLAVGKDGAIVMKPPQRKYQLHELVSKITAGNRHEETDWGPRVGKEAW